jgi:hypothetical protein
LSNAVALEIVQAPPALTVRNAPSLWVRIHPSVFMRQLSYPALRHPISIITLRPLSLS